MRNPLIGRIFRVAWGIADWVHDTMGEEFAEARDPEGPGGKHITRDEWFEILGVLFTPDALVNLRDRLAKAMVR